MSRPRAWLEMVGYLVIFLVQAIRTTPHLVRRSPQLAAELRFVGTRSTLVIAISGGFIGMVVAVQFYDTLVRFGSVGLLGSAVGLALTRELAPVVTALMVIARVGSSMAAELGIMRADHQIDALECMAINPFQLLVLPKLAAIIISLPILVALFIVVGTFGGYAVGVLGLGLPSGVYLEALYSAVHTQDLLMALVKALTFGLVCGWICIGKGFLIHRTASGLQGSAGVSKNTTEAVVAAAVATLFVDYVLTAAMI